MVVATVNLLDKYKGYIRKLKEGSKRVVIDKLTTVPDKEFRAMYKEVTSKDPDQGSRHQQIDELILAFEGMTA